MKEELHFNWVDFKWNKEELFDLFGEVKNLQGNLCGFMKGIDKTSKLEVITNNLTLELLKSAELKGDSLDQKQAFLSASKILGITVSNEDKLHKEQNTIAKMLFQAVQDYQKPLSNERILKWHSSLFYNGESLGFKIEAGKYRQGEMKIEKTQNGNIKKYFQGIPSKRISIEMDKFIAWFNEKHPIDPIFKAAIAHFWLLCIQPFDDGNERIATIISDILLARTENSPERFYSLSNQLFINFNNHQAIFEKTKNNPEDLTNWIYWFLNCIKKAILHTETSLKSIFYKNEFWKIHEKTEINERQRILLNLFLEDSSKTIKSSYFAKVANCSPDTALRDIKDLINKGILKQDDLGGRSTNYMLVSNE